MTTIMKVGFAFLAMFFGTQSAALAAKPEIYLHKKWEYAVDGYDVTTYFDGTPIKGDPKYAAKVANATYIFASQENLDKFLADEGAFRPAYGGYCAYALGKREMLVHGDPKVWYIKDGVLYLNFSRGVQKKWLKNIDEYIANADRLWPDILNK